LKETTAARLQTAMRGVVQRGSAQTIAHTLDGTGWQIGGKTGTGPGLGSTGPPYDGWFAGLVFDPQGKARFTVATYVRHGGLGGENAAIISAQLARFLIEAKK
jgi:cell division protein FtsI/penicillin-binding protein 2